MNKIELRDYQLDIVNQTLNSNKSTLIQIPTGGGKTLIAKEIIADLVEKLNLQVLFVAPKIILMEQTAEVFKSLNPHIVHGIHQYDTNHKVLVSTIQTASKRDINPDVIIIDEVHYGYEGKMIERLIKDKPNTRIIGLSATPYDKNGNQLQGFELILDKYDLKYMVENKYLVNIESQVLTKIRNLDRVKMIGGDYNTQELSKIVSDNKTILEIVGSTAEHIQKYKKAIVFAVDINHAELLTKSYQKKGFNAKVLHSKLNEKEQENELKEFKEGQTKILVSVAMLTTGFDMPDADVAIIARPTKSQNLYKQMVGRVLRLAPNKTHALLLDCGNIIENLGMPLDPIKAIQKKEIANNQQQCEYCESNNLKLKHKDNKSFWECEDCGHTKDIEHGVYKCKLCGKFYTHNAKFSINNNKLWLNCDICPHPTLISEYTGSEIFVLVGDKENENINNNKSLVKVLEEEQKKKEKEQPQISAKKNLFDLSDLQAHINKSLIDKISIKELDTELLNLFLESYKNSLANFEKLNAQSDDIQALKKQFSPQLIYKVIQGLRKEIQSLLTKNIQLNKDIHKELNKIEILKVYFIDYNMINLHNPRYSLKDVVKLVDVFPYISRNILRKLHALDKKEDEKAMSQLFKDTLFNGGIIRNYLKLIVKKGFKFPTDFESPIFYDKEGVMDFRRTKYQRVLETTIMLEKFNGKVKDARNYFD